MKVCIIIPPSPGLFDDTTNIPLGPLYVAAVLIRGKHEVELVSMLGHNMPRFFPEADLYAMGYTTPQAGIAQSILHMIRSQYPKAMVLAAGAHPSALPGDALSAGFDSVLVGEAEITIFEILEDLENLKQVYIGVPPHDLGSIPFPARHLLPEGQQRPDASPVFRNDATDYVACIQTSRGCPGQCSFCSNVASRCRYRSAEDVAIEMSLLVDKGIRNFKFQDDTFTLSQRRVAAVASAAREAFGPGETHVRIITRADTFHASFIPHLKDLNVEVASFGIESGSQRVLDWSNKHISVQQIRDAISLCRDAGIKTFGYFIFGLPGENERTVDESIEFLRTSGLDVAVLSTFTPYPGTAIYNNPAKYKMHIIERDWNAYWQFQKRTILALPYDVSFDKMMRLREKTTKAWIELGYSRPEWEKDL